MATRFELMIRTDELCQRIAVSSEELREIVAHGIVEPEDAGASEWLFAADGVCIAARAVRLHRDLHIDWPGVALALELLDSLRSLRRENEQLLARLERFEAR